MKYKNSGVEWIGAVPAHWESLQIRRLTPVKRGASPRPIDDQKYFDENGEFCWVRIADVSASERYLEKTTQTLSELGASLSVKRYPGDFFLSIAGTVGKPIITKIKCCIHDGFVWFPNLKINPEYLYYIFSTGLPYQGLGKWGTQLNLNTDTVAEINIPIPLNGEIDIILKYLDHKTTKIDSLIEKKKWLIELLKEERTAVINQAVSKGLDPNVPMKDSGIEWLGEIPEHWEVKKLKHITSKITDGEHISPNFQSEGMPFLSAKDVRERTLNFDGKKFISIDDGLKFRKRCDPVRGDVLLVSRGATIGRIGLVETDDTFCLLGSVILLKPLERGSPLLLYYVLNNSRIQEQLLLTSQSSAQQAIYLVGVSELLITIPPANEQPLIIKHIEKETSRIDSIISKSEKEIELLQEYRTALISEVVTGKIDVREEKI
ncbi:MAG: restriction endonuclease subunit S [bacterium]